VVNRLSVVWKLLRRVWVAWVLWKGEVFRVLESDGPDTKQRTTPSEKRGGRVRSSSVMPGEKKGQFFSRGRPATFFGRQKLKASRKGIGPRAPRVERS